MPTFCCPHCGKTVTYDPNQCVRLTRLEDHEGRPHWCVYAELSCPYCGLDCQIQQERRPMD